MLLRHFKRVGTQSPPSNNYSVVINEQSSVSDGLMMSRRVSRSVDDFLSAMESITTQGAATITPSLVAHRTSGTAPLAVHLDATGTTSTLVTYPTHDLTYFFDYDDAGAGNFAISGNTKESKMGPPIGAHVYETAGTYTPTMYVRLGVPWVADQYCQVGKIIWTNNKTYQCNTQHTSGGTFSATNWTELYASYQDSATLTATITVASADTTYATTATIAVAPDSDWTGAPSGATQVTSLSGIDYDNHRVLLKRGIGTSYGSITLGANNSDLATGDHDFIVGAFGTGSKPIVTNINFASATASANWSERGVLMDLNIMQDANIYCTARNILFLRCEATDTTTIDNDKVRFMIGGATTFLASQSGAGNEAAPDIYFPEYIFVVDCVGLGTLGAGGHAGGSGGGSMPIRLLAGVINKGAVMGGNFNFSYEQTSRIFMANHVLFSDNNLGGEVGVDDTKGALKLQALGGDTIASTVQAASAPKTQHFYSVDDDWGSVDGNTNFVGGAAPENVDNVGIQRLENVSFWRLTVQRGDVWAADVNHIANLLSMHGCRAITNAGSPVHISGNCIINGEDGSLPVNAALYGPYLHEAAEFA